MTTLDATRDTRAMRQDTFSTNSHFRKDTHMYQAEIRLAEIREQHDLHRSIRLGERHGSNRGRSLRLRLGESLMRLGREIGGDALREPRSDALPDVLTAHAWQG